MNVEVHPATREEHAALAQLVQLYVYDFSELLGLELGNDGRFTEHLLDELSVDGPRRPFLIRVAGHLAGFAIVQQGSRLTGDPGTWDMAEFFIVRRHRRTGVGSRAAHWLFAAHRGRWEVRQRPENVAATAFWRRIIASFAGGQLDEVLMDDAKWRGPVQRFAS